MQYVLLSPPENLDILILIRSRCFNRFILLAGQAISIFTSRLPTALANVNK